ncbi:monoglyceride lipase-like [Limulus polyphemus]|uniref:Monoglyceride lipase-like n=1 Tax=Limulus polyphemus TaxID=6850 RepID=A0ABM1BMC6_LIMPO|nr:monoglyceride lipase-like [Limulus polyphemus]
MSSNEELSNEVADSYYIQSCTGQQLFCKYWPTEGKPRALAFVAHGYAEHCCIYEDLAQALVKSGILTFGHDHVGHGRSEGSRTLVGTLDNCVEDVFRHVNVMKEKYPGLPVFLVGHSMGGTIGVLAALKKPEEISGFVAIAAGISWNSEGVTPLKRFIASWLGRFFPSFPVSTMNYDLVIRTEEGKQKVLEDPYMYKGPWVKAGWAKTMLDNASKVQAELQNIDVPLLILHGGQDKICDISGAKKLYETSKTKDKTLKVYPDSYHCLFLEPDGIPEQVIDETVNWITTRIQ